ncbi:MAG: hypothetical protein E7591_07670 [Ruminococcaceae bacterium]|nr:hypothetical protein [Oscillospiraceae bacterium]
MKKLYKKRTVIDIVIFIILPFSVNIVLESLNNKALFGGFIKLFYDPYVFLTNTLILILMLSPGILFNRFRYFWAGLVSAVWIILGTVNYIITINRTLPFTAYDLGLIDTLPLIIKKYLSPFYLALVCLFAVALILGVFIVFFRAFSSPREKISTKRVLICFIAVFIISSANLQFAVGTGALKTKFPELSSAFKDNGFVYSFMISLVDKGIDKPEDYSKELIDSIKENFHETDMEEVKTPNVIFLQMESFFDISALNNVEFSREVIPNFSKLLSECPSGLLSVPVIGAGTVNTEFEVVTGMRVADFGAGEYPYKTILTEMPCESLATNLKPYGYTSHFIHNYKGGFYGRNTVYANLGYDYFYSVEYMTDYEKNENGWAKDKVLLRYINECLDETEGVDLITAISVQGHGNYSGIEDYERHVKVTKCKNKDVRGSYEFYANQLYEMDIFLGELISSIEEREEQTLLVIYGDHLPSLEIKNDDLDGRGIYETDYLIWNNFGMRFEDENISSYQLSSKVLAKLGINEGVINSCHQCYINDSDYLSKLQALSYDILYGEAHAFDGKRPYRTSDMKINRRKIKIHNIELKDGEDDIYIITGEGFSENSYVRVGYNVTYTEYVDENTLLFKIRGQNIDRAITVWEKDIGESEKYFFNKAENQG